MKNVELERMARQVSTNDRGKDTGSAGRPLVDYAPLVYWGGRELRLNAKYAGGVNPTPRELIGRRPTNSCCSASANWPAGRTTG